MGTSTITWMVFSHWVNPLGYLGDLHEASISTASGRRVLRSFPRGKTGGIEIWWGSVESIEILQLCLWMSMVNKALNLNGNPQNMDV